jgi:hypothetical protein
MCDPIGWHVSSIATLDSRSRGIVSTVDHRAFLPVLKFGADCRLGVCSTFNKLPRLIILIML